MSGRTASKQIGALWKHTAKQGNAGVFLRGILNLGALGDVPIAIFKNTRKTKENQPDYRIVLSGTGAGAQSENAAATESPEEL